MSEQLNKLLEEFDFAPEEKEQHKRDTEIILGAIKKGKLDLTDDNIWILADPLQGYTSLDPVDIETKVYDEVLTRLLTAFGENYQRVLEEYQESLAQKTLKELRSCKTIDDAEETDAIEVLGPLEDIFIEEGEETLMPNKQEAELALQRRFGKHYQEIVDVYKQILDNGK